ncbi:MAG: amino acid permease [Hyphomicrobiaceae bacterium]|nr:amino acid permease [Hyphomicrobiaceae bacterium]
MEDRSQELPRLKRSLTLLPTVLYGLGVTIGAGIYVLIGIAAGRAGMHAPLAFLIAALLLSLTACSFAELAGRLPVSASEAAYVREGLGSPLLALIVGLLVIAAAIVAAAAISVGSAGYVRAFVDLPEVVVVALVVLLMGGVAAAGINESIGLAGVMTVIEIGGLLVIIVAGLMAEPAMIARLPEVVPAPSSQAWLGILGTAMIAVFAFVGFEGLVNIAEEVKEPERTLPRAIFLTLGVTAILYFLVIWVCVTTVPADQLAASRAPLGLVFEKVTGGSPLTLSAVAIVATLNGIIVQIIMASRVTYGLARQGSLPSALAGVDARTRTPLLATGLVVASTLVLAVALPLERLAEESSRLILVIFALVNLALLGIKVREAGNRAEKPRHFSVPWPVPLAGAVSCVLFLVASLL